MGGRALAPRTEGGEPTAARGGGLRSVVRRHPLAAVLAAVAVVGLAVFVLVWFEPQALFIDERVNEAPPSAPDTVAPEEQPGVVVASGEFRSLAHSGSGRALILELSDGTRYLRFEDLDVENGPDLRVYLSPAPAEGESSSFGRDFVDLGPLKGNQGSQNYELPPDLDVSRFTSVAVWCRRFSVGFAVAPLVPGGG